MSMMMIGYNDDLLIQILSRLPAHSVVRFRSVSKHWQSILSHREFTLLYDKLSVLRVQGIFYGSNYVQFDAKNPNQNCPLSRSPNFHLNAHGLRIVQSCNGLLLCCVYFLKEIERVREYYVFNPTTKQLAIVCRPVGTRMICFLGLVYHPTVSKHYKIVCMYTESSHTGSSLLQLRFQIYTSDIEKWRILSDVYELYTYPSYFKNGVYVDGVIYFNSWYYFNLEQEKLQKLELLSCPHDPDVEKRVRVNYFGESRGHLHMVVMIRLETRLYLCIYELMRDHSGLVVMFQILIEELLVEFSKLLLTDRNCSFFEVLDVVRGEKEGDTFMVLKFPGEIRSYNLLEKSYMKLCDVPTGIEGRSIEAHRYIQTIGLF